MSGHFWDVEMSTSLCKADKGLECRIESARETTRCSYEYQVTGRTWSFGEVERWSHRDDGWMDGMQVKAEVKRKTPQRLLGNT